jgi:hypothetical protein
MTDRVERPPLQRSLNDMDNQVTGLYSTAILGWLHSLDSGVWADQHLCRPEKECRRLSFRSSRGIRKARRHKFNSRSGQRGHPFGPSPFLLHYGSQFTLPHSYGRPGRGTRHSLAYGNADRLRDQVCCVANIPGAEMRLTQTLRELKQCYRTSMSMPLKVSSTLGQGFLLLRWLFFATEARWTRRGKRMKATFSAKSILRWQCDDVLLQYVRW